MFVSISSLFGVSLDFMVYIFLASVIYFSLLFETGAYCYNTNQFKENNHELSHSKLFRIGMTGDRIGLGITQTLMLTGKRKN